MTKEKKCTKCGEVKGLEYFAKNSKGKHGVRGRCKDCGKGYNKSYYQEYKRKWAKENKEYKKEYKRKHYQENKERYKECNKEYSRRWIQDNPDKNRARTAKKRARKRNATPEWLTEEQDNKIKLYYKIAKALENIDGVKRHVDHIVPLKGKGVRGLHVPWNLQILTAEQNLSKNNSYSDW